MKIGTIYPPDKPIKIPESSQWLLGEGGGVWFCIEKRIANENFRIQRFTPNGNLDCDRFFEIEENGSVFDIDQAYKFVHVSHCAKCRIEQHKIIFVFNYTEI